MRQLVFGRKFLRSAKNLDKKLGLGLKLSLDVLLDDPFRPTLHTKPLTGGLSKYYSFRFGRNYRVIFRFVSNDIIQLIDVGHRRDIYR